MGASVTEDSEWDTTKCDKGFMVVVCKEKMKLKLQRKYFLATLSLVTSIILPSAEGQAEENIFMYKWHK